MSKYNKLWEYIKNQNEDLIKLCFEDIKKYGDIEIDHSFLKYKKELIDYGYEIKKISLKESYILFKKVWRNKIFMITMSSLKAIKI